MISDKNKRILGKLFQRYYNQSIKTTSDIEHANLSSISTLYLSFKGEIIKNDQFYKNYCEFFNHTYKEEREFEVWLDNYISKMIHTFDYYEEKNFDNLYNEFVTEFNDYKDYAIYHEYYLVIQSLFNYYRNNKYLRLEEVEDYLYLIDIDLLPKELSLYLLDYMFRSNWNYIGNKELIDIVLNKMKNVDENHLLTKYQIGMIYKYNCNFVTALSLFEQCYQDAKNMNNHYKASLFLLAIYIIYRNTDDLMEEKISKKLLEYNKKNNLPRIIKHNINHNIGMQDYLVGRYERAYTLFNENINKYNSNIALLFQCSICSRLNKDYPVELFSKEIEDRYDFIYLDYFRKKSKKIDNEKLAKYVIKTIVPKKLKDEIYRNPYWSLFEYEIKELAHKDKKLKKYYFEYLDFVGKYCKNS